MLDLELPDFLSHPSPALEMSEHTFLVQLRGHSNNGIFDVFSEVVGTLQFIQPIISVQVVIKRQELQVQFW